MIAIKKTSYNGGKENIKHDKPLPPITFPLLIF
jgi:hypothetical protein